MANMILRSHPTGRNAHESTFKALGSGPYPKYTKVHWTGEPLRATTPWRFNIEKGKDPVALLGPNIHFAIMWVRYDRRIAGRTGMPDVYDYRSCFAQQHLSEQGQASPNDRSDPSNAWIDWTTRSRKDDPTELVSALEVSGLGLDDLRESA